jgi:hypothetical protein
MKSLSKRTKNESFIDDADASIELGRPPALVKSSRYISLWQSNLVQVDVSHFRSLGTKFYEYDLDSIVIWCGGGHGSIYDGTKPLSDFPNFQEALKFSINETLKKHKTHLRDKLASTIRICTHFFGWLVQRGIYLLSDCSRADIDNLIRDVASHSWNGVADLRRRLQQLARDLARKPEIAVSLASSANYGVLTINIQQLERTLGVPVGGNDGE